jgi:amidophosphoribosyltransferase
MGKPGRDNASPQFCDACFSGEYPIALTDESRGNKNRTAQLSLLTETD